MPAVGHVGARVCILLEVNTLSLSRRKYWEFADYKLLSRTEL